MSKKLASLFALLGMVFTGLIAVASPAQASGAGTDATLASMTVTAGPSGPYGAIMSPSFDPSQSYYEVYSGSKAIDFTPTANDSGATIKVTGGDQNNATMTSSSATTITFPAKANNMVTVVVTAANGTTQKTYKFNTSATVMPQPEIVSYTPKALSTGGGDQVVTYVKHLFANVGTPYGTYCNSNLQYEYPYTYNGQQSIDRESISDNISAPDANGIVTVTSSDYGTQEDAFRDATAKADLIAKNTCLLVEPQSANWAFASSTTNIPAAFTFFNPKVTSVDIGNSITPFQIFNIKGPGVSANGYIQVMLQYGNTNNYVYLNNTYISSSQMSSYFQTNWSQWGSPTGGQNTWGMPASVWANAGQVNLIVQQYDDENGNAPVILYQKTLNYTPEVPTQVAMSPNHGPLSGGNKIVITGHHLCIPGEGQMFPGISFGTTQLSYYGPNYIENDCTYDSYSQTDGNKFDGMDKIVITAPPALSAGSVDVSMDIGFGYTKLLKYTYSNKPTITAIAPTTVSNVGGSTLTLTGTDFGISGTPTVTIDGIKSPLVQRLSNTKVLAMVPADTGVTGPVDVNIISSSGGGALDTPSSITLAASSNNPTISSVSPSTGGVAGGDVVTITGSGFSTTASGVTFGGVPAQVDSATATTLTVETPTMDNAGTVDVTVGTPTGISTKPNAFTFAATPGVTSVSPSSITTLATGNSTKVTINGVGFGSSGTITVGSAKAAAYTATGAGTRISGISIPNSAVGSVGISILPKGSKIPFTTAVMVYGPNITYVGSNPYNIQYGIGQINGDADSDDPWLVMTSTTAGGTQVLVQGTNFGASGMIKVGSTLVTPTSYSDTAIVFNSPAIAAGTYAVQVIPASGTVTATLGNALIVGEVSTGMTVNTVASSVNNARGGDRNTFDPVNDASDLFTVTGKGFLSTDNGASTKILLDTFSDYYNGGAYYQNGAGAKWVTITPVSVTDTTITFHAPKSFPVLQWITMEVKTATNFAIVSDAIYYVGVAPQPTVMTPSSGLCLKSADGVYTPAVVTASGPSVFGASGTVSIGGVALNSSAVNWSDSSVVISFANLPADLANPWGSKEITFTPSDGSLVPQTFAFDCKVSGLVTTQLNGSTNDLTISAGTAYTASTTWYQSIPGTTYTEPAGGYYYASAADYTSYPRHQGVRAGLPTAAGEYYVWANASAATWDSNKYISMDSQNVVHLTITGSPVTFTPKLASGTGNSIVYRGQLGDGTNGSANDIAFTQTATADKVTSVTWQYRNHQCALNDPNTAWTSGLPNSVAISVAGCGGDGTTVSSWDIRVAGFQMLSGGVDKAGYYLPTYNTFNLTITKKSLTISAVKATKPYDGTTAVTLGDITVSGAAPGDTPTLDPGFASGASFADPNVGNNKPITLSGPFQLSAADSVNYILANPNLVVTGNITKANAIVALSASTYSVIMSNTVPTISMTVTTTDAQTNGPEVAAANTPDPVLVSTTPAVCSISGTTVTPIKPGDCTIRATQAASADYNAAVSYHDNSTTNELVTIKIYPAPKVLQVVADDIQVAVGDTINPTYSTIGLLDGDSYDNVSFEYYQGSNLLSGAPTAIGTYKIVPTAGNVTAADTMVYSSTVKYVAGKLVITAAPPVITASSPAHGPEAGGNTLLITGTSLDQVTSVKIGDLTIRKPKFVVNGTGTSLSLKMPAGTGAVTVALFAGSAEVDTDYTYDAPVIPASNGVFSINLKLDLQIGAKLAGQKVTVTGGGLKANSDYVLTMHSTPVVIYKSVTDASGNFAQSLTIPAKACLTEGRHDLTLAGISPAGAQVTSVGYFYLDNQCNVAGQAEQSATAKSWTLSGFLFDFLSPDLNAGGLKSLTQLAKLIKGAKTVTIYGYTETDTKSAAVKAANIVLAQGRCDSVKAFLKGLGINAKYTTVAKGGVDPVSLTDQAKNRRVVISATY